MAQLFEILLQHIPNIVNCCNGNFFVFVNDLLGKGSSNLGIQKTIIDN